MRDNSKATRDRRKAEALAREASARIGSEQIAALDNRLGSGVGARKERARLSA